MAIRRSRVAATLTAVILTIGGGTAAAGSASAAEDSGWQTHAYSPYLDGCGMNSYLYTTGASSNDYGCAGDVGEKIKYTIDGVTWISGQYWGDDYIWVGHSSTFAFRVYH